MTTIAPTWRFANGSEITASGSTTAYTSLAPSYTHFPSTGTIMGKTVTYDFVDERCKDMANETKNRIWQYVATEETDGKVKVIDSGFLVADSIEEAIAKVGQSWPLIVDLKVKVKEF